MITILHYLVFRYDKYRTRLYILVGLLMALTINSPATAVDVKVDGISGALKDNVEVIPALLALQLNSSISPFRLQAIRDQIQTQAADALKPFGYYQANIQVDLQQGVSEDDWTIEINIDQGQAVKIDQLDLQLSGPGREQPELQQWYNNWPLKIGQILNQLDYAKAKKDLERLGKRYGYLDAGYTLSEIRIDPETSKAFITLHFDTRDRAVFGQILYTSDNLQQTTLDRLPQFKPGDPYLAEDVEALRSALAASGYFNAVDIIEQTNRETSPPTINLQVQAKPKKPNTYTAGLGLGTDTGPRFQAGWDRHQLNRRGDSLSLGLGVQAVDQESFFNADYLRPRGNSAGDFYFASLNLQRLDDDFEFEDTVTGADIFEEIDGERISQLVSIGIIHQNSLDFGVFNDWFLEQRYFLSFLNEDFNTASNSLEPLQNQLIDANPGLNPLLNTTQQALTAGTSFDVLKVQGAGFTTHGTRAHLRVLGSLSGVASDVSFAQAYFGINQQWLLSDRSKLLLSAEVGYTEASTTELDVALDDEVLSFSLTSLPERYRFQAGGDRSIRGFGFESLSNNRNGSNHLITASAEYEYRIGSNWSLAGFIDTGNAFNNFNQPELRTAIGIGARFYTLVGPVRLDFANALGENDNSFRLHLTIGSPIFSFGSRPFLGGPN